MKVLKLSALIAVSGAVLAGAALFWTSQNVQQAESRLNALQTEIAKEQQSIRVLRAEWDYLNTPERLEKMATHYLEMVPQEASSVALDAAYLPDPFIPVLPARKPDFGVKAQNVSVTPVVVEPEAKPAPQLKEPSPHKDDDFRSLLDNIKKGGE